MSNLSALLSVKDGVAVIATLRQAADAAIANGDPRTRGQVMADTLVGRIVNAADQTGDGVGVAAPALHLTDHR